MNNLRANIFNELQKLFLKKKIVVFLILTALACFISAFFISVIQSKLVIISLSSVSFPLLVLSIFTNVFLPLFIFMAGSELFPGEVGNKSLKLLLLRPISRLKIFISKNITLAIYIIINLMVVFLVSLISCIALGGSSVFQNISQITFAYFIDIIPAVVLAIFTTFIVQFFKGNSGALITCILSFITLRVLSLFIKGLNNAIFTSYLNWYAMVNITTFLMVISYGIIFFTIGFYFFDKREV